MGTDNNGNAYMLQITGSTGRAAYTGKAGDSFTLLVIIASDSSQKTCTGTVQAVTGTAFTLKPKTGPNFTVKRGTSGGITGFTGTITLDNGDSGTVPVDIIPSIPVANGEQVYTWGGAGGNEPVPYTGSTLLYIYVQGGTRSVGGINNGTLYLHLPASIDPSKLDTDLQSSLNNPSGLGYSNVVGGITVSPNTIKYWNGTIHGTDGNGQDFNVRFGDGPLDTTHNRRDYIYVTGQTNLSGTASYTKTESWSESGSGYTTVTNVINGTMNLNNNVTLQPGWNKGYSAIVRTLVSDAVQNGTRTITETATTTASNSGSTAGYKWFVSYE
jgi:hypothetical protein